MERIPEDGTKANKRFVGRAINLTYHDLSDVLEEAIGEINLTSVATEISARWRSLSQEDRIAATAGSMRDIEEEREAKDLMLHNVPLRAFYDARSTVQTVEKEVRDNTFPRL